MQNDDDHTPVQAAAPAAADPAGQTPVPASGRRTVRTAGAAALLLAASTGVSALTASLMQPETVKFDMKGTLDLFVSQTATQNLKPEVVQQMTSRFNAALGDSLSAWQQTHRGVVLVSPAVVSAVPDITPQIRADVAARMQAAK